MVTPGAIAAATASMTARPREDAARIFAICASVFTSSFRCNSEPNSSSERPFSRNPEAGRAIRGTAPRDAGSPLAVGGAPQNLDAETIVCAHARRSSGRGTPSLRIPPSGRVGRRPCPGQRGPSAAGGAAGGGASSGDGRVVVAVRAFRGVVPVAAPRRPHAAAAALSSRSSPLPQLSRSSPESDGGASSSSEWHPAVDVLLGGVEGARFAMGSQSRSPTLRRGPCSNVRSTSPVRCTAKRARAAGGGGGASDDANADAHVVGERDVQGDRLDASGEERREDEGRACARRAVKRQRPEWTLAREATATITLTARLASEGRSTGCRRAHPWRPDT